MASAPFSETGTALDTAEARPIQQQAEGVDAQTGNGADNGAEEQFQAGGSSRYSGDAPSPRFSRPPEPDYNLSPAEHLEIRNSNLPLTIGLMFSVIASFLVFFASLVGGTAGDDPIMPSFWRGLGALAVFTTLSFVVSWFMPAPSERRLQLRKLGEEPVDLFGDSDYALPAEEAVAPVDEVPAAEDVQLMDELDEYDGEDDDELEEEDGLPGAGARTAAGPER